MKPSIVAVALLATLSFVVACSGGSTGGGSSSGSSSGSSGTSSSSGSSGTSSSSGSSGTQSCQSSSINGQCLDGPHKGASCCYKPESAGDPPCSSSNDCDNVCKYCK